MILVTLGTQKESFKRLLDYIENSHVQDRIIVQAGYTKYESKKMEIYDFFNMEVMDSLVDLADIIITHGGTGSIVEPLKKGKKIIGCARLSKYNEHIDDHQLELIDKFYEEGYILKLDENTNLDIVMDNIKNFNPQRYYSNTDEFIKKLKKKI